MIITQSDDARTDMEKAKQAKRNAILNGYLNIQANKTEIAIKSELKPCQMTPHRIMGMVAKKFNMTVPGVKGILIKAGVYKTK